MKEQINNAIEFIKQQKVHGCITGSCLLDYFEGQDIDVFLYTKSSFIKMYYILEHNPMFLILDSVHRWSANNLEEDIDKQFKANRIVSIKFVYNTCIPINIVWKQDSINIYSVLSSFDMNIICKGYDLLTKKELDLTEGSTISKIADWNRYNTKFYKSDLWTLNNILRQFLRVVKYYDRGYNVDLVVKYYIKIIDEIQSIENIFKSANYDELLKLSKENTKIMREILVRWLETHTLTDKEKELIEIKIKELN